MDVVGEDGETRLCARHWQEMSGFASTGPHEGDVFADKRGLGGVGERSQMPGT